MSKTTVTAWAVVPPSYRRTGSMDFTYIRTTEQAAWSAASVLAPGHPRNGAEWARHLYCEQGWRAVPITIAPRGEGQP